MAVSAPVRAQPATVFVIDGSGDADQKKADRKRPIYQLDVPTGMITRPLLSVGESVLQFLSTKIDSPQVPKPVLIAADVPIGLPASPDDVFTAVGAASFLTWLDATAKRLEVAGKGWRHFLIAIGVQARSAQQPFVSIAKGEDKAQVCHRRRCDIQSNGESVYCLDHGSKQVGRAAMQFWFELLLPLRTCYGSRLTVWPFEPWADCEVIVGECYPRACHDILYGMGVYKKQSLDVAKALWGLAHDPVRSFGVELRTWIYAASSEDEFDMFTTAVAFRELLAQGDGLLAYPDDAVCRVTEGWMIGLPLVALPKPARALKQRPGSAGAGTSVGVLVPGRNRHNQEDLGRSGNRGPKGPLDRMKCHRTQPDGALCGHQYETNAQDVFQKKCPVCQP